MSFSGPALPVKRVYKNLILYALVAVVALLLLSEVAFFAGICIVAFKLDITKTDHTIPAIMIFLLLVGWIPLLLQRYMRRAFVFSLLVMTASFAIADAVMSMLIVTDVRPLKLPAVVGISWIAGGLWGWAIVYLDKHRWRIGEKLAGLLHGHKPMDDLRDKRPVITVAAAAVLAVVVCAGIWALGREKLFREIWKEAGYQERMWILETRITPGMFQGKTEKQLMRYLGESYIRLGQTVAGGKNVVGTGILKWSIGISPLDPNSHEPPREAWLCFRTQDGVTVEVWVEHSSSEWMLDPDARKDE